MATSALRLATRTVEVGERLGAEPVQFRRFEAEHVAGQVEGADLAAAVFEDLVGAHRAADHLIEILRRLLLAVDLGVAVEAHRRADQPEGLVERARRGRRLE